MARLAIGVLLGTVLLSTLGISRARAEDLDDVAAEAGVDPTDLLGAVVTTGMEPRHYLVAAGELAPPRPPPTAYSPRVECVIWNESRGNPNAVNPRSGASGLGQFLPSTWRTTPQGKVGYSVFNAAANREAVAWMLSVGRAREFDVVRVGLC